MFGRRISDMEKGLETFATLFSFVEEHLVEC
jgi:hypothetical protein